jgi:hypothetical protein
VYFGLNEGGSTHVNNAWQPSQIYPDAFRFVSPWNNDWWPVKAITDGMNLGSYVGSRIGIVALYGSPGTTPDGTYYGRVKDFLDWTPPNLYVQVWNEPNLEKYGAISPSKCRDLIASAVKADAGRGRVIGPAMSPSKGDWASYMAQAYADHNIPAAVHIYPRSNPWTADFDYAVKQAIGNNANPNDPFYITEMALRSASETNTVIYGANWAQYTRDAYVRASQQSQVRAVIFHRLRENTNTSDPDYWFDHWALDFFLNGSGNPTQLVTRLDEVR